MILYSFRRCPYAMRARMALLAAGVECELREVALKNKPAEMLAISPKGTVPVLQLADGSVIDESLEIMQWALGKSDAEGWLAPELGTVADMVALIAANDGEFKQHLDRYKYLERFEGADSHVHRQLGSGFLLRLESMLNRHACLFGNTMTLADIAIFPFVRQFAHTDRDWFESQSWSSLQGWLLTLTGSALFEAAMVKHAPWQAGDKPVFLRML